MDGFKRVLAAVKGIALAAVVAALAFAFAAAPAKAATVLYSGTWGTCPWEITSDGVLTVHPGTGEDIVELDRAPWWFYMDYITSVVVKQENGKKVMTPSYPYGLFEGLYKVTTIDVSGLDTSNAVGLSELFLGCSSLTSLDLSSLDTSNVKYMGYMFYGCSSLKTIKVGSGWTTAKVTSSDNMFSGCISLVGGNGTKFNSAYTDATLARIDKAGSPGYLTAAYKTGWAYENGAYYYYNTDGSMRKNAWAASGKTYYYLGADGRVVTNGWASYNGQYYYMGADGKAVYNSWVVYGGKYYYINGSGHPVSDGWMKISGKYYYFDTNGNPVVNDWVYYKGSYYYLNASGNPVTSQWIEYKGTYYHFNASGVCDRTWKAA